MAFKNPCDLNDEIVNTGTECSEAMGAPSLFILGDTSVEFTPAQVAGGMLAILETAIHAAGKSRIYPLFGNNVPVRDIQNTNGDNVLETLQDGSTAFVRSGKFTRLIATKEGGDCLAKIFYALNGSTKGFIEIDGNNKVKMRKLANGNYGFFPTNMIDAPLPTLADYAVVFKNAIRLNFDPKHYVKEGVIFQSDEDLQSLSGLVNAEILEGSGAKSTTKLYVKVRTICALTNLVAAFPVPIVTLSNFVLTNVATGAVITPSAAAIVAGEVEFTVAVQTPAAVIRITGAPAATLKTNGITGFDITKSVGITIP